MLGRALRAPLPDRAAVRAARRLRRVQFGRVGLERFYNDELTGRKDELTSIVDSLTRRTTSATTCRRRSTRRRRSSPTSARGPQGRRRRARRRDRPVRVMAGTPSFDPNRPERGIDLQHRHPGPVSAGLDVQDGDGHGGDRLRPLPARLARQRQEREGDLGTPLNNFGSQDYGDITLTEALTNSVNTVWAEVGVKLGRRRCRSTWIASASGRSRRWTIPPDQMSASGRATATSKIIPMSSVASTSAARRSARRCCS